jgi:hypothetical protein
MAKTQSVARGSTPPLSAPPKCNKRDINDNVGSKQKHNKTNNDTKSKKALIDTDSKTGAVTLDLTVHDVDNDVATCTADPTSSGNACNDKQQQKGQSMETTEESKSNAEGSKTMQKKNINTPVLGSMVS